MVGARDVGAQLNLVGDGADCGFGQKSIQMSRLEVRNADGACLAGCQQLLKGLPGGDILVALGQRPVDQQQIDVCHVKLTQTFVEPGNRAVIALKLAIQLGRDE